MNALLALFALYLPLSLGSVMVVAEREDRRFLTQAVLVAWVLLGTATAVLNAWLPFTEGGDDQSYYQVLLAEVSSSAGQLDFGRFSDVLEQPGYPLLLGCLSVLAGEDLLAYKFSNLMFFILLSLTWYRIGLVIESKEFARRLAIVILLLFPLHYYVFFLLKDMFITLLQSIFLLGLLHHWINRPTSSLILMASSMLGLILFRIHTLAQDTIVALTSISMASFFSENKRLKLSFGLVSILLLSAIVYLGTNPELMYQLGIRSDRRIIGSDAMWKDVSDSLDVTSQVGALLPVVWLLTEVAIFNPGSWDGFDSLRLRGLLALPWIFLIVPMFLTGLAFLFRSPVDGSSPGGMLKRQLNQRLIQSPWSVLLVFLGASFTISMAINETVRYRLPDMPVMAAIATAGWVYASPRSRKITLSLSFFGVGLVMMIPYLVRSF
jgi:hypothetical protein